MGQNNGHNSIRFDVIQIMQQKGIVCLALGCNAIAGITWLGFFISRVPVLRVGRVGNNGIQIKWVICPLRISIIKPRPVIFQRITATDKYIIRLNTTHNKIHSCQVVSVFLPLLRVVHYIVLIGHIFSCALTDGNQQRTRAAGWIKNFDFSLALEMVCNNLRHEKGNFVGRIEFSSLFSGIGRKVANKILIDEAQNVIILFSVRGNIFD
ncbi:hypothetical protein SDC9_59659 [bioreactor metagenome]|uniref:Uncharacterized protein n=1 Tax=bioreactor metagenome TaxID=1076179 RepID=A0A644XGL9_9ZZZZ